MLCALQGDALWVLAIDCTSKNGIKHTLETPFVKRNQSFQVEHLTLCVVWPGRIPSSGFQAQEKEGWSSHIGQGSLPISFSQPQSSKGGNGRRSLKNIGNWAHFVFYCVSKPIEASRGQPSNDAGISDTALIHSIYMEGRDNECSHWHFVPGIGQWRSQPFPLPASYQWANEINLRSAAVALPGSMENLFS